MYYCMEFFPFPYNSKYPTSKIVWLINDHSTHLVLIPACCHSAAHVHKMINVISGGRLKKIYITGIQKIDGVEYGLSCCIELFYWRMPRWQWRQGGIGVVVDLNALTRPLLSLWQSSCFLLIVLCCRYWVEVCSEVLWFDWSHHCCFEYFLVVLKWAFKLWF